MANSCMVDLGQKIIDRHKNNGQKNREKTVTVSQLRKFLSSVYSVYNKLLAEGEVSEAIKKEIKYLKIILVYSKKDRGVENLLKDANSLGMDLIGEIDKIVDENTFTDYYTLLESIVAYHKFYGLSE